MYELYGIGESAVEYFVPGVNDEKYIMNIDFSKDTKDKIVMILHDASSTGFDVVEKAVAMEMDFTSFGSDKYNSLMEFSDKLGNISKGVNFAFEAYGIHCEYEDLVKEISQSSTITDKDLARTRALELRDDRIAFLAMCTVLPMLVAGSTMAGPALLFSGMLALMSASSEMIFDMRIAKIKEKTFKLNWIVDPSGYIYDLSNNNKIEGATVSAYWIPYDDTEDFWQNKPLTNQYGTIWDASEYEQANPLMSDDMGRYSWDVPEGWWRVKVEKDGYETVWSDWMTVPPVQTDVNLGMSPIGWNEKETPTKPSQAEKTTKPNGNKETSKSSNGSKVVVSSTSIKKVKAKKKALKVTWKKAISINGYQIQYSTSNKFKKSKTITIKKSKTTSKIIKKLKSKKKYYVRIRTYIISDGKNIYSNWSKAKSKKTK